MNGLTPYFEPLRVGAVVHDLGHLDPIRFQVPSEKLRRSITVRCRFSNHVFSRAFDPNSVSTDALLIMDGVRQRIFCRDRYRLSLLLPAAVLGLRDPRTYVRETKAGRNWLYVATVELLSTSAAAPLRYQVFFALRKASKGGTSREDVEMVVESAYAEDPARPPGLLGRTLFVGLATAAVEGRQVHTQGTRKR